MSREKRVPIRTFLRRRPGYILTISVVRYTVVDFIDMRSDGKNTARFFNDIPPRECASSRKYDLVQDAARRNRAAVVV